MSNPNAKDNLKPFVKGYDPRRHLAGVPKDSIPARKFIRKIGAEVLHLKDEQGEGDITRFYAMVRRMFSSGNPRHTELLLKAMYAGLLKDEIELGGEGGLTIKIIKASNDTDTDSD